MSAGVIECTTVAELNENVQSLDFEGVRIISVLLGHDGRYKIIFQSNEPVQYQLSPPPGLPQDDVTAAAYNQGVTDALKVAAACRGAYKLTPILTKKRYKLVYTEDLVKAILKVLWDMRK